MAIYVKTDTPSSLLDKIKNAIDEGDIRTWEYDKDGDFNHSPKQWDYHAWLRPYVKENLLVFGILSPTNRDMTKLTYAIYHGRFAEMLLNHFDGDFTELKISSHKTSYDIF